ncbi:MAG: M28 family metallopeptidase [Gemmatimonadaceae bacterium]
MRSAGIGILRELASSPRFAGSEEEARAREYCAEILRKEGFSTYEEKFDYSAFPASWAPPLIALVLILTSLAVARMADAGAGLIAPATGIVVALLAAAAGKYLSRGAVLGFPLIRRSSINLVGLRAPEQTPEVWLVAHLDSKSQTIPMLGRIASVTVFAALFGLTLLALLFAPMLRLPSLVQLGVNTSILSAISLLPLLVLFIGNRSNGALDNASGVATVLLALRRLQGKDIGVVFTSAEELALAGARAFVATRRAPGVAINCDTIDDAGRFLLMKSGTVSRRVEEAVGRACSRREIREIQGDAPRLRGMLPGVMADNIAFSQAGWESFTISRGNLRTLARVHTTGDNAGSMEGRGVDQAALLIAAIVEELH